VVDGIDTAGPGTAPEPPVAAVASASVTEERNPRTLDIDTLPTSEVLEVLNAEDATVPAAVAAVLPELARLVDAAAERVRAGGRLHYFGAGSAGRIAVLDAAELPPTFGVDPEFVTAHLAGGDEAVRRAVEDAEDDVDAGTAAGRVVRPGDVAVGVSASGTAPYVTAAVLEAARRGALTALVTSDPGATLGGQVDVVLAVDTGPEPIAGSTRMKAGTAQKLLLNGFSTALMIRLGRCYSTVMVEMVATNRKLRGRLVRILEQTTGAGEERCRQALADADGDVKVALVAMLAGTQPALARLALVDAGGLVRDALGSLAAGGGLDGAGAP
jgi:N-acetylmuramic acid 6-phosphate etherase